VNKDIVVLVEGDGGAAQAITYATITRDAVVPITCTPATENNA
jgi:shikimate 5-dehydrogenase